jgi:hypothetical protein
MKFVKLDVDTELSPFPDSSLPYMVMIEGVKLVPSGLLLNAVSISGAVIGKLFPFIDADERGCS